MLQYPGSQTERVKDCRASGTSITIIPTPKVSVATRRSPDLETGSVDRTAGACRRGPAEPEVLSGHGGVRPMDRALPLSFLFLGLGFAGILLGDRRRALHDVIAGTAVIYSWDARAARLRFLSRE